MRRKIELSSKLTLSKEFIKGLWENNPVFKAALGLCPTLAVTVSAINGIAMALATTFVLVFSSFIVSLIRKLIPPQVRIAAFILIIATFVTIVDLVMKAQFPDLSKALGPYIPLIVVNCLILGRQEAFSSKNSVFRSVIDALGMGTGFLLVLFILGGLREIFGSRTLLGFRVMPDFYEPWLIMILPAGAFLTLGLLMGLSTAYTDHKKKLEKEAVVKEYLKVKAELSANKGS
ncbi:MAG: electron transport complex subunit E [Melioribacteraceae bacterium]|nr:electron transport complex subunit E [Melioribacteraceae bacterium]